ncbi:MAG: archaeosortase/exosortase family protein, partial [Planctomycetes bacterium]|nr:archaeosortase/exosortase family protein [Planctomycetota bacterium]
MVGGQLFLRRRWSRGAFILLSIPVTILKNSFRIVAISLLSVYVDPAFMDSYLHRSGGIFFFALALLCLVPVWWILQRLELRDTPEADPASHGAS